MLNKYFLSSSYVTVGLAAVMLIAVGGVNSYVGAGFVTLLTLGVILEKKKWQLSERFGTATMLVLLIAFLVVWKYAADLSFIAARSPEFDLLSLFLLTLTAVKMLQVKGNRDWLFIYLLSFFSVLLAAGMGGSSLQSLLLLCYLCSALMTLLCFANRGAMQNVVRKAVESNKRLTVAQPAYKVHAAKDVSLLSKRLPIVAICLVLLTFALSVPIFLLAPRLERSVRARATSGVTGFVGFSGQLRLGQIGRLQQNDEVVMRVRLDDKSSAPPTLRWRGTAFDNFDGREWQRSDESYLPAPTRRANLFDLGTARSSSQIIKQTIFLEPLDTPVLFAAPRAVAIEGTFPYVFIDSEDGLTTRAHASERISYRAYSDVAEPTPDVLRFDDRAYLPEYSKRYVDLSYTPDPHIAQLAADVITATHATSRYEAAQAIEAHLRENYSYTLDMKSRGDDPLADFLFNVRAGHCEYFASAMAVMLRTQGIASRVVNGFQQGRYNRTADAYTVRQRDAHAWIEVFFPETGVWVSFDPTPAARPGSATESTSLDEYAEALEMLWVQYVATYGRQEQQVLVAKARGVLNGSRASMASLFSSAQNIWDDLAAVISNEKQNNGARSNRIRSIIIASLAFATILLLVFSIVWMHKQRRRKNSMLNDSDSRSLTVTEVSPAFYRQMLDLLAKHERRPAIYETPLEFAVATQIPEVMELTGAYHRVRYGGESLSAEEEMAVEKSLRRLEGFDVQCKMESEK